MIHVAKNVLVHWNDPDNTDRIIKTERILAIRSGRTPKEPDEVCVIDRDRDNKRAFPRIVNLEVYQVAIRDGIAWTTTIDPLLRDIPPEFVERLDQSSKENSKRKRLYEKRDERWSLIEPLVVDIFRYSDPTQRGKLLRSTMLVTGKGRKTLEKWCTWYFQEGMQINALMNHNKGNSGAPGQKRKSSKKLGRPHKLQKLQTEDFGVNLTPADEENFLEAIQKFLKDKKAGKTKADGEPIELEDAFYEMLENHYYTHKEVINGSLVPQIIPREKRVGFERFKAFYYEFREQERIYRSSLESKHGASGVERDFRALEGNKKVFAPGSQFQIDATIGDLYLISQLNRKRIIGRPVIYIISDSFSHMIVAFAVTLEGPSWLGATEAFQMLSMDKVELCQQYGIIILPHEWPSIGFPFTIVADNGEMAGKNAKNLLKFLGVRSLRLLPPFRPDWKGLVENDFVVLNNELISWIPGHVYSRSERGSGDYRLDAKFTLHEFRRIMLRYILRHNHRPFKARPQDKHLMLSSVRNVPIDLWEWGMSNRVGALKQFDYDYTYKALLPRVSGRVTASGIRYKTLYYECKTSKQGAWQMKARNQGTWSVRLAVDVRNPNNVYLCDNDGEIVEPCQLKQSSELYQEYEWYEILDKQAIDDITEAQAETEDLQKEIEYRASRRKTIDDVPPADFSDVSRAEAVSGIRDNRQDEKDYERQLNALHPNFDEADSANSDDVDQSGDTSHDETANHDLDALRANRKRNKHQLNDTDSGDDNET